MFPRCSPLIPHYSLMPDLGALTPAHPGSLRPTLAAPFPGGHEGRSVQPL